MRQTTKIIKIVDEIKKAELHLAVLRDTLHKCINGSTEPIGLPRRKYRKRRKPMSLETRARISLSRKAYWKKVREGVIVP